MKSATLGLRNSLRSLTSSLRSSPKSAVRAAKLLFTEAQSQTILLKTRPRLTAHMIKRSWVQTKADQGRTKTHHKDHATMVSVRIDVGRQLAFPRLHGRHGVNLVSCRSRLSGRMTASEPCYTHGGAVLLLLGFSRSVHNKSVP